MSTPAEKRLAKALRDHANDAVEETTYLLILARLVEGKTLAEAMGAPGDWGYDSPIGSALYAYLQEDEPARHTYQWHYLEDRLPGDDTAVLVATTSSGQPGEAEFRDGVFFHPGSDIAFEALVYAWADLPEIPEQRKGGA